MVRVHSRYTADSGLNPSWRSFAACHIPLSPVFPVCLLLNKGVYTRKNLIRKDSRCHMFYQSTEDILPKQNVLVLLIQVSSNFASLFFINFSSASNTIRRHQIIRKLPHRSELWPTWPQTKRRPLEKSEAYLLGLVEFKNKGMKTGLKKV